MGLLGRGGAPGSGGLRERAVFVAVFVEAGRPERALARPLREVLAADSARVQGAGFRVQGSGFRVQGAGCMVHGSGFRIQGLGSLARTLGQALAANPARMTVRNGPLRSESGEEQPHTLKRHTGARFSAQGYLTNKKKHPPRILP